MEQEAVQKKTKTLALGATLVPYACSLSFLEDWPPRGESGDRRGGVFSPPPVRQRNLRVDGEGGGAEPRGSPPISPLTITEGPSHSRGGGALSKQQGGEGLPGSDISAAILGRTLSYTNMARHQRSCRVWDPGGGPRP